MMEFVIFSIPLIVIFIWAEIRNCRKGRDVWDWTHKLSKWLKTKGY